MPPHQESPLLYFCEDPPQIVNTYEPFRVVLKTKLAARQKLNVSRQARFTHPDRCGGNDFSVSGRPIAHRDEATGHFIFPDLMVCERDISTRQSNTMRMIMTFRLQVPPSNRPLGKVRVLYVQVVPNPRLPDLFANALVHVQALGLSREQIETAIAAVHARRGWDDYKALPLPASGNTSQGRSAVQASQPLVGGDGQGQQTFTAPTQIQPDGNGQGQVAIPLPQTQGFVVQPQVQTTAQGQQVVWTLQPQAAAAVGAAGMNGESSIYNSQPQTALFNEQGQPVTWVLQPQFAGGSAQGQPSSWSLLPQATSSDATGWNGQSSVQAPQPDAFGDNGQGSSSVYRAPEAPM